MLDCQDTERQQRCGCPRLVPDFIVGMLQMPDRAVMGNPVVREWKPPTQISFKLEAKLDMTYGPQTGQGLWVALRSHIQDQEVGPTQMTRTVRVICVGSTFWAYYWAFKVGSWSSAFGMAHAALKTSRPHQW